MRTSVTYIALRKAHLLVMLVFTLVVNAVCFGQAVDDDETVIDNEPHTSSRPAHILFTHTT